MHENKKAWDDVFKKQGRVFNEPHPDVVQLAKDLQPAAGKRILDLGSGSGRHVVHLAKAGYEVHGFDYAQHGIDLTRKWLEDENLEADLYLGDMTGALPFEDHFFDAIISIQVIHHARLETIEATIAELVRILKPNGALLITVPETKNQAKTFEEIAPNTFIPLDGIEKGMPHYYFDEAQLRKSFSQFKIHRIYVDAVAHYSLRGTLKANV